MLVFPNCKINLGLHIIDKREDGFHNIETAFYPIPFYDSLEVIKDTKSPIQFTSSGLVVEQNDADNICVKAYHLLKKDFPLLPGIAMHLHKTIPAGAGLGGGSSDASFVLKLLNDLFQLNLSTQQLLQYAAQLGSDCPFFIINKPCLASGRGEILQEIKIDLSGYNLFLINPAIHINTGWAFSQLKNYTVNSALDKIIRQPVDTWKHNLKNDLEEAVFKTYPEIEKIKQQLYQQGASYSSMSGSGSTVFGLFKKGVELGNIFPAGYFTTVLPL